MNKKYSHSQEKPTDRSYKFIETECEVGAVNQTGRRVGIKGFSAYVPFQRLQRMVIAEAWADSPDAAGEKAVAGADEDSVSMAVNAAVFALEGQDRSQIAGLYFATTTAPYAEKGSVATMATALNLTSTVRTSEWGNSLLSSMQAFTAAIDSARAGAAVAGPVIVAAADSRLAAPEGSMEALLGDGAAAFLIGAGEADDNSLLAEIVATHTYTQEGIGHWRNQGDTFLQQWEDRFVQEGYVAAVVDTIQGILKKSRVTLQELSKIILAAPSPKMQLAAFRKVGVQKGQMQQSLLETIGFTGAAHWPMMLADALENAQAGDRLLAVGYGEGATAMLIEVTPAIQKYRDRRGKHRLQEQIESKNNQLPYTRYLKWKGIVPTEAARRPETPRPSVPAMTRNYQQNLGLHGSCCTVCGTPQFPKQRVCVECQAKDQMESYPFYDKQARVMTYTIDHLAASLHPPTVVAVVDFEGGGRMMCEVTDCDPQKVHIGMELEMTFRRLYQAGGIHNYFWKAKPKHQSAAHTSEDADGLTVLS